MRVPMVLLGYAPSDVLLVKTERRVSIALKITSLLSALTLLSFFARYVMVPRLEVSRIALPRLVTTSLTRLRLSGWSSRVIKPRLMRPSTSVDAEGEVRPM